MDDFFDIVVSGGGVAGLTATAIFADLGYKVLCVEPNAPVTQRDTEGADLRSTAFLQPSVALLKEAGVWDALAPAATPLQEMQIIALHTNSDQIATRRSFKAKDVDFTEFGFNVPNWQIRAGLVSKLEKLPTAPLLTGVSTAGVLRRENEAIVTLSNGRKLTTKLVLACDGRQSPLRAQAGIGVKRKSYGQKALAFHVSHPIPHKFVSTEFHQRGGPFTLVPLPDHKGSPASAVVWMEDGPKAQKLANLPVDEFEARISARSAYEYGPLKLISKRTVWPVISQVAEKFTAQRLALVAEAAHAVPPIGAQGLNMSLADIALLAELSKTHELGSPQMMMAYEKGRERDIKTRVAGIDLLNRASQSSNPLFQIARNKGIELLHDMEPIRKTLMRMGLGQRT